MTPFRFKYPPGTELQIIIKGDKYHSSQLLKSKKLVVRKGPYDEAYDFEGINDSGWCYTYIEDPTCFKLITVNWKKELGGK